MLDRADEALLRDLTRCARGVEGGLAIEAARRLLARAEGCEPSSMRAAAATFEEMGRVTEAAEAAGRLSRATRSAEGLDRYGEQARALARAQALLDELPEPGAWSRPIRRVLYVVRYPPGTQTDGYALRTERLVSTLRAMGLQVTVAVSPGFRGEVPPDVIRPDGPRVGNLFTEEQVHGAAAALAEVARREGADAVMAASNHANALPALLAACAEDLPFVYDVRGFWYLTQAALRPGFEGSDLYALWRDADSAIMRRASRVVAISEGVAQVVVKRGVPRERILLARNGVTADPPPQRAAVRARRFGSPQLVFVGSVRPFEGLDALVRAAPAVVERHPDARFVIVGDGSALEGLRWLARLHGVERSFRFTGRLSHEEAIEVLHASDVAVVPRKDEPVCRLVTPLKIVEAMAAGLPVVASDLPALREASGGHAVFVPPDDERELGRTLLELAEDDRLRGARAQPGQRFVRSERTWEGALSPLAEWLQRGASGLRASRTDASSL